MQQIAQGTHNYQQLGEIMPMIYKRFTEKTAEEWRQIYKVSIWNERVLDYYGLLSIVPPTTRVPGQKRLRTCRG